MSKVTSGGGFGDSAGGSLRAVAKIEGGFKIGGIMANELFRPINDRELRKAIEQNEREAFLAKISPALANQYRRHCRPVKRESVGEIGYDHNIVVNTGLDDILDQYFNEGAGPAMYVGLKDTGTPVAADTMASHASWATISPYSNATDPQYLAGAAASQSIDNSASKASFSINASDTVFGAFLKDNNTKGGATGLLVCVVDFAASRAVENGDTLETTYTLSAADDGV
jgi:hypothetical protein